MVRKTLHCIFELNTVLQTDNITRHLFFMFIYKDRKNAYELREHVRKLRNEVNEHSTILKGASTTIVVVHFIKRKNKNFIQTNCYGFR